MAHSEVVIGRAGWNGWALHVSEASFPVGTEFQPLSARFPPASVEMQVFNSVFPLDGPRKIANYWLNRVQRDPQLRGFYSTWLSDAALETVRRQRYRDLPSRLDSIFGFRCGAEAIRFACHYRKGQMAYLYEFQPGPDSVMVDMRIWDACKWDYANEGQALQILTAMADAYWQSGTRDLSAQGGLDRPELLMPPPVRVVEPAIPFERER